MSRKGGGARGPSGKKKGRMRLKLMGEFPESAGEGVTHTRKVTSGGETMGH